MTTFEDYMADGLEKKAGEWITAGPLEFYVRRSMRDLRGSGLEMCLDIANFKGSIDFTAMLPAMKFLNAIETSAQTHDFPIFVENVLNERLLTYLRGRGYALMETLDNPFEVAPCLVRFFEKETE